MSAIAPDMMASPASSTRSSSSDDHSQAQSVESSTASVPASTPFPVSTADSEESVKTAQDCRSRRSASGSVRLRGTSSSSSGSRPRSILIFTDPVIQVTPAVETPSRGSSVESDSPPLSSSSESESQTLPDGGSRTTLSSTCGVDSAASSTRTRATTLSSASSSPCVTFAPLPELGPRKRRSSRPLGIAARGQILRQRRMMMTQDKLSYYDNQADTTIPFNRHASAKVKVENDRARRDDLEDTEIALAALGKMLGEATKNLWQRVANSKAKDTGANPTQKRPKPSRGFTWPGRLRSKSTTQISGDNSDDDSDEEVDGPWTRRRDEDPMTKTIMEGSDDGLEQFVLSYEAVPVCEEEEEDFANARADEEMRTTVEVRLVKTSDGESSD